MFIPAPGKVPNLWKVRFSHEEPEEKRNEVVIHATTWMNLGNTTLKDAIHEGLPVMIPFLLSVPNREIIETKNRLVVTQT